MAYEPGDLAIKMDGYKLNIRSVGIIIHNGKVLLHKRKSADYYALLGGHVRIGESSQDTVKREMQEELGKEIEITGYISTIENFFELKDLKYHEIMFVYKAEFCDEEDKKIEQLIAMGVKSINISKDKYERLKPETKNLIKLNNIKLNFEEEK